MYRPKRCAAVFGCVPYRLRAVLPVDVLPHNVYRCAEGCQEVWNQCCASLKGMCTPSASNTGYDSFM